MPAITPLPTLDRTAATFKTDVDNFFSSDLPTFVTETNAVAADVAALSNFNNVYLGAKASAPTVDNEGNQLADGAMYFNTGDYRIYVYDSGSWVLSAITSPPAGVLLVNNNLSDLNNITTARSNLGLAIGTNVQAYDANLDTLATKTAPSGNIVGTSDTQTLTNKTLTSPTIDDAIFTGDITEQVYSLSGTTPVLDPANGTIQTWTLSANSTPSDGLATGQFLFLSVDDGTDYTITWPTIIWKTATGLAPDLLTTGYTHILLYKIGTTLYGKD